MNFYSAYQHGFVRVAACTHHTTIGDPAANAASVLGLARECHDDGVALAVFPELTLSGYSIEDILLQDALLDAVEEALARSWSSIGRPAAVLVVGAPLRHRHRIYNTAVVIHRGAVLGVAPKSYLPTYREFYERRQMAPGDDIAAPSRRGRRVPVRPGSALRRIRSAGLRAARRDLRGHVGADPAQCGGRTGRSDGAGQPVRQPDHHRPGRRPKTAGPVGVVALPGRLRLCRSGRGRVDDRSGLGRPDDDL